MSDPRSPQEESAQRKLSATTVAIRCFRDTGDHDYIAARLAYRSRLVVPFLWSALQAIEKYLKCILILNGISAKGLGHDIKAAFDRINQETSFKITLNKLEQEVFDHIAEYGPDRYLIYSYFIHDKELLKLDMLVWHLRQYCRPLDFDIRTEDGQSKNMFHINLKSIDQSWNLPPKQAHIATGKLEEILTRKTHPARAALVWKNMRYCAKNRKGVMFLSHSMSVNAPLWLHPEMLPHVRDLMQLSKEDIHAYTEYWNRKKAEANK